MRKSNFALRVAPTLLEEARKVAESEGIALNQLINIAIAKQVTSIRASEFFRERSRGADIKRALAALEAIGGNEPPQPGDELPDGFEPEVRKSDK